jgi:two-component sensor histidine kinase
MRRLAEFDFVEKLKPCPAWVSQIIFAVLCVGVAYALRVGLNTVASVAAPFALLYPPVIVATLFARWQSGVMALVAEAVLIWFVFLPMQPNLDQTALLFALSFHVAATAFVLAIVEMFRRTARSAVALRETHARELDHRVKNNFAMIVAMLSLQKDRSATPEVREAVSEAIRRIESLTRAHAMLNLHPGDSTKIDLATYLGDLCRSMERALLADRDITLECRVEPVMMEADRAISVALIINELVTNAVKHAFVAGQSGRIVVTFERSAGGWRFGVSDNGKGMEGRKAGTGQRLVASLVKQLQAVHTIGPGPGAAHYFALAH